MAREHPAGAVGAPLLRRDTPHEPAADITTAPPRPPSPAWSISRPPRSGGRALGASDDFFAGMENLLAARARACSSTGKYTDRGKWMDGWESRRKRARPGPRLVRAARSARRARCVGFDVDTAPLRRQPPAVRVGRGLCAPHGARRLPTRWTRATAGPSCSPSRRCAPTRRTCSRRCRAARSRHVRLNIFPDGGVARFRVFGRVHAALGRAARARRRDARPRAAELRRSRRASRTAASRSPARTRSSAR